MRTHMRATSIESYAKLEWHLGEDQKTVYECIQNNPNVSDRDISNITGLEKNNVNGRRNELFKMGLIEYNGDKIDRRTNRRVSRWIPSIG